MHREWHSLPHPEIPLDLRQTVGGHPLVSRLLVQRGFVDPSAALAFLEPTHYQPAAPQALLGVVEAASLLHKAIKEEENILVWGDFDVDGQTSTSLLVSGLRRLTAHENVRYHVPNRFKESHGIKPEFLQPWIDAPDWQPQILLTCDTGIAEAPAVAMAKDAGWTVIITDHHDLTVEFDGIEPGVDQLWGVNSLEFSEPNVRIADVIINPKFQPEGDPLRTLPGVGVAYKLIQQLYIEAGIQGKEEELLDLVALGIVADVAEQVHDARYLLQLGLDKLSHTQRTGLIALMEVAKVKSGAVRTDDIGFQIGPRMNALGRLEDASVAVELLTTDNQTEAAQLAAKMERLNQQRRLLTTQINSIALEMIDRQPDLLDYNALVLAHPGWHAGIVGIVASRLVEEFNRPVVLLLNPPGEPARGSARSISGVDIGSSIAGCAHLLLAHGGHPGAAGLSLLPENIDAFRRELDRQIEINRTGDGPPKLQIDAELALDEIDMQLVEELQRLAPFGNGNPTPNFVSAGLQITDDRRIGREGTHRKFSIQQVKDGPTRPVLWFNSGDSELPVGPFDLVYTLSINEFKGERSIQLMYVDSRPSQIKATVDSAPSDQRIQIHDMRSYAADETNGMGQEPLLSVQGRLPGRDDARWYAEGINLPKAITYAPRHMLTANGNGNLGPNGESASALVLWSTPPSAQTLQWIIENVAPSEIYIVGQNHADDSLDSILRGVAGMCKYVLNRQGQLSLVNAASRLGTTPSVIRHSLRWLECKGLIMLDQWPTDDIVQLRPGATTTSPESPNTEAQQYLQSELSKQLAEVRAYRRYFNRASVQQLGIG